MQRIAGYEVLSVLGRGAMGAVFEVRAAGGTERLALKLLEDTSPEVRQRFGREARILELLGHHRGIVRLRATGEEQNRPFLVMDLLPGGTFAQALERGTIDRARALALLIEVARSVHFAHEAGIVHRDLKPANILLDEDGGAHVTDFGIAKDLHARSLTRTGTVIGTYEYMSPEQADPTHERPIDRRADVYALGAILYRILAGRPPFEGPPASILKRVLLDPPPPPSSVEGVPLVLATVCLRALEKEPAHRQQTAEDFAREVELALKVSAPVSRLRSIASLLAVAVPVAIAAGVVGSLVGDRVRASSDANAELRLAWSRAEALLRDRVPLDEPALQQLSDLAGHASGDDVRAVQNALPFARARSRLLANAEPDLDTLPHEGAERELFDAELATLGRDGKTPEDAWKLLERTNALRPSWRADLASERWTALARRFVAVGKPGRAAAALVIAGEHASREASGHDQAAALIDEAVALDLAAVAQRPGRAPALLAEAALQALSDKSPSPRSVKAARRRLYHARLLDPGLALAPARPLIVKLGQSSSPAVRGAARPWIPMFDNLAEVDTVLDAPVSWEPVSGLIDAKQETWPAGWVGIITKADLLAKDRLLSWLNYECLSECVLWRPDMPLVWFHLGVAAANRHANDEARRCYEIGLTRCSDGEITYHLGLLDVEEGRFEEAIDHLERAVDDFKRHPPHDLKWARFSLAEALARTPRRAEGETILRELEGAMKTHRRYWLLRADLAAGTNDEETCRANARKAPDW
jgi:tetratricopeptide (TPR) repeat protein